MRKPWPVWAFSQTLTLARSNPLRRPFSSEAAAPGVAVKKVTRSNFESALEDLRVRVRESDFVAVDLEMTGITSAPWRDSFEFDRSDVRYLKVKDSAEKFAVVQFGVCPFRWDPSKSSFIAHPHNIFIFPRKELPIDGPSYEFLCQTTSMDFLAKYQFDFNACIHEGVSYLSRAQEVEALRNLSTVYGDELADSSYNSECVEIPLVSTADVLFTERIKNKIREWRNGILKGPGDCYPLEANPGGSRPQFQTVFFKMRPAVTLNGFSSHQLKLIQLVLRKHFKDLTYVHVDGENLSGQKKVVYTDSKEDRSSLMKEVQEDLHRYREAKVRSAVGFRHVIDLLVSEQKLIVGHNCFLDIAHIHSKFFGPLPSTMVEFASSVHKNFPYIIDTKHLLKASRAIQYLMKKNSTSLSSAFSVLCPKISSASYNLNSDSHPFVKVDVPEGETGSSSWNSGAKHEAGYDAFMTGCVFAQACSHLGINFELQPPSMDLARNDKLQTYINLVYPSWNSGTVINLSTGTEIPESGIQAYKRRFPLIVYANIVLVWGFPLKFKPKELRECISEVFGPHSVTSIFFLDETAALIQFSKEGFVNEFLILKDTLERNEDPISVLHPLSNLLEGGKTRAANYDTYKQICSASVSRVLFADQAETVGIRWNTKVESGNVDTQEFGSDREITADTPPVVKHASGRKSDGEKQSNRHFSCEEIIDSLYASKSLFGKRMTST